MKSILVCLAVFVLSSSAQNADPCPTLPNYALETLSKMRISLAANLPAYKTISSNLESLIDVTKAAIDPTYSTTTTAAPTPSALKPPTDVEKNVLIQLTGVLNGIQGALPQDAPVTDALNAFYKEIIKILQLSPTTTSTSEKPDCKCSSTTPTPETTKTTTSKETTTPKPTTPDPEKNFNASLWCADKSLGRYPTPFNTKCKKYVSCIQEGRKKKGEVRECIRSMRFDPAKGFCSASYTCP